MIDIKYKIDQLKQKNTIIIVFANSPYLPVLNNWLCAINRLAISNFLIIALDKNLFKHLQQRDIPVVLRQCDAQLDSLWVHRIEVIKEILETGSHVLHSDADAVWLKNPLAKFIYDKPEDMIFSQGTVWPPDVHEKWRFVLCCGFFFIKSNRAVAQYMHELSVRVKRERDDQVSVNRLLLSQAIQWKTRDGYSISYADKRFLGFAEVIVGTTASLAVALLPHAKFQRVQDCDADVYVKHMLSDKNSDNILDVLKEHHCFLLDQ